MILLRSALFLFMAAGFIAAAGLSKDEENETANYDDHFGSGCKFH